MREVFSAFGFQVFNRIGKGESLIKQNSPFFLNIHVTLRVKTFLSPFCVGIRCLSLLWLLVRNHWKTAVILTPSVRAYKRLWRFDNWRCQYDCELMYCVPPMSKKKKTFKILKKENFDTSFYFHLFFQVHLDFRNACPGALFRVAGETIKARGSVLSICGVATRPTGRPSACPRANWQRLG